MVLEESFSIHLPLSQLSVGVVLPLSMFFFFVLNDVDFSLSLSLKCLGSPQGGLPSSSPSPRLASGSECRNTSAWSSSLLSRLCQFCSLPTQFSTYGVRTCVCHEVSPHTRLYVCTRVSHTGCTCTSGYISANSSLPREKPRL